jgi:hypothetical protein
MEKESATCVYLVRPSEDELCLQLGSLWALAKLIYASGKVVPFIIFSSVAVSAVGQHRVVIIIHIISSGGGLRHYVIAVVVRNRHDHKLLCRVMRRAQIAATFAKAMPGLGGLRYQPYGYFH